MARPKKRKRSKKVSEPEVVEEVVEKEVEKEKEVPSFPVSREADEATDAPEAAPDPAEARDQTLANIYDVPETERDLAALRRSRRRRIPWWVVVSLIAAVLLASAATGFWFFTSRGKKVSSTVLAASIQIPDKVASGAPVDVLITAKNTSDVGVRDVEFTAQLPEGAAIVSSTPGPLADRPTTWSLPAIAAGADASLTLHIRFSGSVGDAQTLSGTFTYRPANTSASFSHNVEASVNLTASLLDLQLDGPLQVTPEREVSYTATVRLVDEEAPVPKEIEVSAELPEGFSVTKATPQALESNRRWRFRTLTAAKPVEIKLSGKLTGSANDLREFRVKVGTVEADGRISSQDEASLIIVLVDAAVTVSLKSGDSTTPTLSVGDALPLTLAVTNSSQLELADATVILTVTGKVADVVKLSATPEGIKATGTLTWTKQQVPALASVKPGDTVNFTVTVPTLTAFSPARSDRNLTVTANAKVTSPSLAAAGASTDTPETLLTAKVNSTLALTSVGRYYTDGGTVVGSGPLPPEVGKTTTYRINWFLSNALNDVAETIVTANLPPDSFWTGKQSTTSTGNLSFDPLSRTVTWNIGRLAAGSTGTAVASAGFEVAVTPKASQAGQLIALVDSASVRATDAFTTAILKQSAAAITSDLSSDPLAQGKGIVVSGSVAP